MSSQHMGSVTGWFDELKAKNPEAQRAIWERFVERLVRFSNKKLRGTNSRVVDADDIANMAFANFFEKTPEQFDRLVNRNDLWQILAMLAERRAIDQIRKEKTIRNGGKESFEEPRGLESRTLTPDIDAILLEEFRVRLDSLKDDKLKRVAIERMQGYRNQEIATRLNVSLRSIERKMSEIRDIFNNSIT